MEYLWVIFSLLVNEENIGTEIQLYQTLAVCETQKNGKCMKCDALKIQYSAMFNYLLLSLQSKM